MSARVSAVIRQISKTPSLPSNPVPEQASQPIAAQSESGAASPWAVKHSFWARAFYEQQIAKGKRSQAAVRALAYKWIRIIWKCWQTRTPYNEVRYLENLRKKGSPLLSYAAKNAA